MGTDPPAAPTTVRYRVLAFLAAMTFVLYLDRVCIGQAGKAIQDDLKLSEFELGCVFSAFTVAYGLFEVPTGRLADRFGSRRILTRIVLWWSFFTAMTGAALGFWMLLVVRFLFGAGEAGALPSAVRVVSRWFPVSVRGTAQGVVTTAMMVGGAVSPITAALLIQAVGWRWTFAIFGSVGVFWAAWFYLWFRDEPREHPRVNAAERELIEDGLPPQGDTHAPVPWRLVLRNRNVWLLGTLMTLASAVFYAIISWYPQYLQKGRGVSLEESGLLTSLVLAGGAFGSVMGGVLTDRLYRKTGDAVLSRCRVGTVMYLIAAVWVWFGVWADRAEVSAAGIAAALFCMQVQIPSWWAVVMGISGRHVGTLAGLMNSLGVIGAITSQLSIGALVDWLKDRGYEGRDQWDPALYLSIGIMVCGATLWLFVRPSAIVEPQPPEDD